jgi:hypothetical protein
MFTSVKFRNFKSLKEFTVQLKRINVLVGPNNAGKSSILDAFRALSAAQTFASRRNQTPITIGRDTLSGYEIPVTQIPISLENIHSDYDTSQETSVTFQIDNGNKLKLQFVDNSRCILFTESTGRQIQDTSAYKQKYPFSISIFPTLGPLEEEEAIVDPDYLRRWQSTRRSNRLFRNSLFTIGSGQNIHLARLSRGRKILFFEGDDVKLMKKFAARLGFSNFENETSVTIVPLGGFSHREKIADAAWTFEKVLRAEIAISAVLDRDYRCPEEIEEIRASVPSSIPNFFILDRKELENYLLDVSAITSAINERLATQNTRLRSDLDSSEVSAILDQIANSMKSDLLSQFAGNRVRFFEGRTRNDASTVFNEAIQYLDSRWSSLPDKLSVVGGKQLLSSLNAYLQRDFGISITATQILRTLVLPEDCDLKRILAALDAFAVSN